jgi:hypothetical protein
MGLLGFDGIQLPPGRYALTLLGSGPKSVALDLPKHKSIALKARGAARPITRSGYGAANAPTRGPTGSGPCGRRAGRAGQRRGRRPPAGSARPVVLPPRRDDDGLCLPPDSSSTMAAPGASASASWGSLTFSTTSGQAGDYVYSGRVLGRGPQSSAAHSSVVISLPR